jgi:hypothetical protein
MKIFLSWSGSLSHEIACIFRDWLPSVIQSVKPYVSSEDIDKGTRWSTDIAGELESSNYGIIIVTKDNLIAQWINFEAGALSKSLDKSNVSPFLFDIKRSEVQGPLVQFQSTIFEKDDVFKLLQSINKRLDEDKQLEELYLRKSFEVWWSELETKLQTLKDSITASIEKPEKSKESKKADILEEILELVRTQQRILGDPERILPKEYLEFVLSNSKTMLKTDIQEVLNRFHNHITKLERKFSNIREIGLEIPEPFSIALTDYEKELDIFHDLFHRLVTVTEKRKLRGTRI